MLLVLAMGLSVKRLAIDYQVCAHFVAPFFRLEGRKTFLQNCFTLADLRLSLIEVLASLWHHIPCTILYDKSHFLIQLAISPFDLLLTIVFYILLATRLRKYFF